MKVSHLLAMTTIVLLSSCSANGKQSDATNQKIKAEAETEEVTFKGDLGQFALRGPVKEFSTPIGVHECFDRDGFLLDTETGKKKESDENNTVKRNEQGRIVRIDVLWNDSFETYDYDERGLLVKNYWEQFGRKVTKNYEYNEKGECLKMTFIETGDEMTAPLSLNTRYWNVIDMAIGFAVSARTVMKKHKPSLTMNNVSFVSLY